jgi:hypothetical protein
MLHRKIFTGRHSYMRGYVVTRVEHQWGRIGECQYVRRPRRQNATNIMRRFQSNSRMGFSECYYDRLH